MKYMRKNPFEVKASTPGDILTEGLQPPGDIIIVEVVLIWRSNPF